MRNLLFSLLCLGIPPGVVGDDSFELCHERGLKLWLHVALSKNQLAANPDSERETYLTEMCTTLHKDFHNSFELGISGFSDRNLKSDTTDVGRCLYQTNPNWLKDSWKTNFEQFYKTILDDSSSAESNPLEALPYIADHYFGDYDDKAEAAQEMRILVIITDKPPRYSPKSDSDTNRSGTRKPELPPKEAVSCDPNTPYLDLKTVFDKFDERYIFPAVMVYAEDDSVIKEWTYVMENSGMPVEKYIRDMRNKTGYYDYAGTVQDIVAWRQCDRIMTTTTIAPTTRTTTTTAPNATTTTTTATNTTGPNTTTTVPATSAPSAPSDTTPADIITTTAQSTRTKPERSKVPIIVGSAAAGLFALVAVGAYRFLSRPPPDLDIDEANADVNRVADASRRDTIVSVDEDAYGH